MERVGGEAARTTQLLAVTLAVLLTCTAGCAGSRDWSQGPAGRDIAEFLVPELVGEDARAVTEDGRVSGRIVDVDQTTQRILVRSHATSFSGGDSLAIAFEDIRQISVSNHRVSSRRFVYGSVGFLAVVFAMAWYFGPITYSDSS